MHLHFVAHLPARIMLIKVAMDSKLPMTLTLYLCSKTYIGFPDCGLPCSVEDYSNRRRSIYRNLNWNTIKIKSD